MPEQEMSEQERLFLELGPILLLAQYVAMSPKRYDECIKWVVETTAKEFPVNEEEGREYTLEALVHWTDLQKDVIQKIREEGP